MFEVVKSRKSKMVLLNRVNLFKRPKDKVAGIAIKDIIPNNIAQDFILEILNCSISVAQGASKILIPDVTAAQNSRTKNAKDTKLPNGSCAKILGRVIKTSPAPDDGSRLNENTAGNIIIPARIANAVSESMIV